MVTFAFGSINSSVSPTSSRRLASVENSPSDANVTASGAVAMLGASSTTSMTWMMPLEATISVVTILAPSIIRPASPIEIIASSPFAISIELPVAAMASIELSAPASNT